MLALNEDGATVSFIIRYKGLLDSKGMSNSFEILPNPKSIISFETYKHKYINQIDLFDLMVILFTCVNLKSKNFNLYMDHGTRHVFEIFISFSPLSVI